MRTVEQLLNSGLTVIDKVEQYGRLWPMVCKGGETLKQVWSCGGGTQSAAIAALIVQGRLPKPDHALIVDTEREKSTTWRYLEEVLIPNLAQVGVSIERVPKSKFCKDDLYGGEDGHTLLIPAFTTMAETGVGKLPTYCSSHWKQEVTQRYLRSIGVEEAQLWIGISRDEMKRIRAPRRKWLRERYVLLFDVPMYRSECIHLVMDVMGWPKPPRSACWMCPNMSDQEWRDMDAEDFKKAIAFDREIRKVDNFVFLHELGKPLDEIDFTDRQPKLGCESGYCFL